MSWILAALMLAATVLPGAARTSADPYSDPSMICEAAAAEASRQTGVPLSVLRAISLTETGRRDRGKMRPWPWTVNMEGKGHWFANLEEARAYVEKEYQRGARSFDVGCFQINFKWHGEAFSSIDEMFSPLPNALYAARFLGTLHAEKGDWSQAAGAYHSRKAEFAEVYRSRFDRFRAAMQGDEGSEIPEIPDIVLAANGGGGVLPVVARVNSYPLLKPGAPSAIGSLVPLTPGGLSLFGQPPETD